MNRFYVLIPLKLATYWESHILNWVGYPATLLPGNPTYSIEWDIQLPCYLGIPHTQVGGISSYLATWESHILRWVGYPATLLSGNPTYSGGWDIQLTCYLGIPHTQVGGISSYLATWESHILS